VHGPRAAGYPATEALVDIRATLAAAADAGLLSPAERDAAAAAAKALFYKRRSWAALFERCPPAAALRAWLPANRVRQKALDAALLLRLVRDGLTGTAPPPFRFERTLLWEAAVAGDARCRR
jgi:hypothetical protein